MSALNKSEKTKKSRIKRDPHKLLEKEEVAGVVYISGIDRSTPKIGIQSDLDFQDDLIDVCATDRLI